LAIRRGTEELPAGRGRRRGGLRLVESSASLSLLSFERTFLLRRGGGHRTHFHVQVAGHRAISAQAWWQRAWCQRVPWFQ
jgi:hypothetical protein